MKLSKAIIAEFVKWVDLNDIKDFAKRNPHLVQDEENKIAVTGVIILTNNNYKLI